MHPGTSVHLADWSTNTTDGFDGNKAEAQAALIGMNERLAELQQLLYAEAGHKMLVVLQGMDTSGKDGTIKHVFRTINPVGVKVANFKRPNDVELAHDYLWRIHEHTPRNGRMVIFNRSHYEDVLVVRVHDLVPEKVWSRRFEHIRGFEQMLADEGTVRGEAVPPHLQEGAEGPAPGAPRQPGEALEVRARRRQRAEPTGTPTPRPTKRPSPRPPPHDAPWYVVPADRKWYRNLVVSQLLIDKLEGLGMAYPKPIDGIEDIRLDD